MDLVLDELEILEIIQLVLHDGVHVGLQLVIVRTLLDVASMFSDRVSDFLYVLYYFLTLPHFVEKGSLVPPYFWVLVYKLHTVQPAQFIYYMVCTFSLHYYTEIPHLLTSKQIHYSRLLLYLFYSLPFY